MIAVSGGTGAALAINKYDPYGKPASGNLGRFGYTGQAWLPELGMWYYKARIYNPENNVARFMQSDPIGYGGGMNMYAYVGGDPVNFGDPFGLCRDNRGYCQPAGTGTNIAGGECSSCSGNFGGGRSSRRGDGGSEGGEGGGGGGGSSFVTTTTTTLSLGSWSHSSSVSFSIPNFGSSSGMGFSGAYGAGFTPGGGSFGGAGASGRWGEDEQNEIIVQGTIPFATAPIIVTAPIFTLDSPVAEFPSEPSNLKHIFRKARGHYEHDNPQSRYEINRALQNYSHTNRFGIDVYYGHNSDGSRTWVEVKNGVISNAGINYPE